MKDLLSLWYSSRYLDEANGLDVDFFFSDINCYQTCSFSALLQLLINRESSLNKELRGLSPWGTKCIDDSVFNFKILDKIVASVPILTLTLGTSGN